MAVMVVCAVCYTPCPSREAGKCQTCKLPAHPGCLDEGRCDHCTKEKQP